LLEIVQRFHRLGYTLYGDKRVLAVMVAADASIPVRDGEKEWLTMTTTAPTGKTAAVAKPADIDLVVALGRAKSLDQNDRHYMLRRKATDLRIPLIHDSKCALLFATALEHANQNPPIRSWKEYVN
jgi:hypothetical protein